MFARLGRMVAITLIWMTLSPTYGTELVADSMVRKFLERELLSGDDFHYPLAAQEKKEGGTCGCLMHLGPTGHAISRPCDNRRGRTAVRDRSRVRRHPIGRHRAMGEFLEERTLRWSA